MPWEHKSVNPWTAREVPVFSFSSVKFQWHCSLLLPSTPSKPGWCQLWLLNLPPAHLLSIPSASLLIWTSSSCAELIITTSLWFSPCVDPPHRLTWVFLDANLFHVISLLRMKFKLFKRVDKAFHDLSPTYASSLISHYSVICSFILSFKQKNFDTVVCAEQTTDKQDRQNWFPWALP